MSKLPSIDELWDSAPADGPSFDPGGLTTLPEPARRYLTHAIAPGIPLASAVRLRMHGEFRLNGWSPFTAEQVIRWDGEMLWRATMTMHGIPIKGFDSVLDGKGKMQWKLFGLIPLMSTEGPDITRSTIGRIEGETVWLPSLLCHEHVTWTAPDSSHVNAAFSLLEEKTELQLTIGETGQLEQVLYKRWGNPEGHEFHYSDFGGVVEAEATFNGYTIPTRMRVGWHFGSDRFETEGEFFRVTIDEAIFR
jgi:hypothetical protein